MLKLALRSSRAALPLSLLAVAAIAQTAPSAASVDDAVAAAKNQLGVLEYCQTEGHIEAKPIEIQTKMLAMLPPPTDSAKVDAAYTLGKEGKVAAMGVEQSLTDAATTQGSHVAALCKQMGDMVEQAGKQMGM